jgi:hypothetical protein
MTTVKDLHDRQTLRLNLANLENKLEELELLIKKHQNPFELPLKEQIVLETKKKEYDFFHELYGKTRRAFVEVGFKLGIDIPEEASILAQVTSLYLSVKYTVVQRGDEIYIYDRDESAKLIAWMRWNGEHFETLHDEKARKLTQAEAEDFVKKL